jgi:cytochrome c oxidase subunit 3
MSGYPRNSAGGRMGMWLFIATEILLFGGLFLLYSMYRLKNPADFHEGSFGTLNTCILITSSYTVARGVHALIEGKKKSATAFTLSTIGFAVCFLIVKAFEWSAKFEHGLYPKAAVLMAKPKGEILFFGLYFMMTGLHAVHVIVGIGVLSVVAVMIRRGLVTADRPIVFENAGLYWHLVDIIWIFLFPLFYLIS